MKVQLVEIMSVLIVHCSSSPASPAIITVTCRKMFYCRRRLKYPPLLIDLINTHVLSDRMISKVWSIVMRDCTWQSHSTCFPLMLGLCCGGRQFWRSHLTVLRACLDRHNALREVGIWICTLIVTVEELRGSLSFSTPMQLEIQRVSLYQLKAVIV